MGRGKKKGDKKKEQEPPSVASLSISEPSTSQQASTASVKETPKPAIVPEEAATRLSSPPITTAQQHAETKQIEEESEGLGLGLGGGRKRAPRKKKSAAAAQQAESHLHEGKPVGDIRASTFTGEATLPTARLEWGQRPPTGESVTSSPGFPTPTQTQPMAGRGWGQRPETAVSVTSRPGFPTPAPTQPVAGRVWGYGPPAAGLVTSPPGYPAQYPGPFPTGQSEAPPAFPPQQVQFAQSRSQPTPAPAPTKPMAGRGRGQRPFSGEPAQYPGQFPLGQSLPQPGFPSQQAQFAQTRSQPVGRPTGAPGHPPGAQMHPVQQKPSTSHVSPSLTSSTSSSEKSSPSKEVCLFKIPPKIPGGGVPYRAIKVLANYLPMNIKALKINRYDVSFKPDKPKKMIPKAFGLAKQQHFPKHLIAFDQMKNCYALKPLPKISGDERFTTNVEVVDNNGRKVPFEVSFKYTGTVDLSTILAYMDNGTSLNPPTEAIQCIDVILRQGTLESYVKAGRQFFKRPSRPIDLGDGLEMWTGLFQSAIFTTRPFINIDVAHKGFPKNQPLIQAIEHDFRLETNKPIDRQRGRSVENFMQFIKGLRVIARVGGDNSANAQRREFICNGLADPPGQITFTMTDSAGKQQKMTVLDYFVKEKKCRLNYPYLNCMSVGPRDKNIYYPIELLEVSYGQALNKQLNEMQLSKMVREAATPPSDRKCKIEEVIKDMNYSRNQYFREFGLEISDRFLEVEARILKPPQLMVGPGQVVEPRKGEWRANRLYKPEALQQWGFIALDCDARAVNYENLKSLMMSSARQMGMSVEEPKMVHFNVPINNLQKLLFSALEQNVKFLFIVVGGRGRDYYHQVKRMAERDVGILTQCIKEFTASRKMNPQTARNILLKVNSKLMGINQVLDGRSMPRCLKAGGVMVVGADVTHPSPDQSSVPSIAAVTASLDPNCYQYHITLSIQTPKKEMIVEFEDMMLEHLKKYVEYQKRPPTKIFVFRDGVSEGQFAEVMNSELRAVHRAYRTLCGPNAKPEVLFLLVQKRHHTRFFSGENNPQNVEPGTVVDKVIVHARELDFYLVSHQAIKGTARPTRYHAVCNDGGIPDEEVEQLTYYLCHLYSRCMRSVSYPTPTYYAHLSCMRARSLTHGERFDNKELERAPRRLRVLDKMLSYSKMFFV